MRQTLHDAEYETKRQSQALHQQKQIAGHGVVGP